MKGVEGATLSDKRRQVGAGNHPPAAGFTDRQVTERNFENKLGEFDEQQTLKHFAHGEWQRG